MSSGSSVTIDFGDVISIDSSLNVMPTLPSSDQPTSTSGYHVDIALSWNDGTNGYWSKLFMFKTDSSDLADISNNTDILMDVSENEFYSGNVLNDTGASLSDGDSGTVTSSSGTNNEASNNNAASEYIRYIAEQIFGRANSADIFQNEAALATDAGAQWTDILADIKTALKPSNYTYLQDNTNPAWIVMSKLLNDTAGTRFDNSDGLTLTGTGNTDQYFMPLKVGDVLRFSINFAEIPKTTHGIGDNAVAARKYRVSITLA